MMSSDDLDSGMFMFPPDVLVERMRQASTMIQEIGHLTLVEQQDAMWECVNILIESCKPVTKKTTQAPDGNVHPLN
jgi:hypothetical protein